MQDVDELRQFIEGGAAQEGAEAGDARVVLLRLHDLRAVLLQMHGPELPHLDTLATQTVTVLTEESRTGGGQLDADGDHDHRNGDDQQEQAADYDFFQTFDDTVDPVDRAFRNADHGQIADVAPACVQKIEHEEIRNHVDGYRGIRQLGQQLLDACLRAHRQRNVDDVHPAFVSVLHQGVEMHDHLDRSLGQRTRPAWLAIVVKPDRTQSHPRFVQDCAGQQGSEVARTHNGHLADVE